MSAAAAAALLLASLESLESIRVFHSLSIAASSVRSSRLVSRFSNKPSSTVGILSNSSGLVGDCTGNFRSASAVHFGV